MNRSVSRFPSGQSSPAAGALLSCSAPAWAPAPVGSGASWTVQLHPARATLCFTLFSPQLHVLLDPGHQLPLSKHANPQAQGEGSAFHEPYLYQRQTNRPDQSLTQNT